MFNRIPQVIEQANCFIDGYGYAGVARDIALPTIEQEVLESKGALSANYGTGVFKAMECSFKISEMGIQAFEAFGSNTFSKFKIPLVFKASIHQSGSGKEVPFVIELNGEFTSIVLPSIVAGSEFTNEIKINVHFIKITMDNQRLFLADVKNLILEFNGVDKMAKIRSNLSL
ncbi:phage major tail tube protein [Campylobacter estrildidarum]|uniref:Phage tail protein n=1 Tax=Campylobacter estrildidarum TaxID=2510189 RepID=A0A4U7BH36_9BACT|nr:phage major tail tube protein [Campylobacter estrildidarum]TKX29521.1 phage tail protein [Campylobacter estrildidarum]